MFHACTSVSGSSGASAVSPLALQFRKVQHLGQGVGPPRATSLRLATCRLGSMNARVDHLLDEALMLGPKDRSAIVVALLDSLDGDKEASVAKAWADEIRRRKVELRTGAASSGPWVEVRARLIAL